MRMNHPYQTDMHDVKIVNRISWINVHTVPAKCATIYATVYDRMIRDNRFHIVPRMIMIAVQLDLDVK